MPDVRDLTAPHVTAVETLLQASGYTVYVIEVTAADPLTYPYLVLHPTPGTAQVASLGGDMPDRMWTWQVTAVGRDWMETATAVDRAKAAQLGVRLVVDGRAYGLIGERVTDQPIRQDEKSRDPGTGRPVFYGLAQFEALAVPA